MNENREFIKRYDGGEEESSLIVHDAQQRINELEYRLAAETARADALSEELAAHKTAAGMLGESIGESLKLLRAIQKDLWGRAETRGQERIVAIGNTLWRRLCDAVGEPGMSDCQNCDDLRAKLQAAEKERDRYQKQALDWCHEAEATEERAEKLRTDCRDACFDEEDNAAAVDKIIALTEPQDGGA